MFIGAKKMTSFKLRLYRSEPGTEKNMKNRHSSEKNGRPTGQDFVEYRHYTLISHRVYQFIRRQEYSLIRLHRKWKSSLSHCCEGSKSSSSSFEFEFELARRKYFKPWRPSKAHITRTVPKWITNKAMVHRVLRPGRHPLHEEFV